jgi:AcrR family transcriptional regulator
MATKRAEQGRATREHIVEVATRLFAEQGYEDTSIEDILSAAGVSRGALYHHFAGKEVLFGAAVELIEARISAGLHEVVAQAPSAVAALYSVALGWIDVAGDPTISRIVLVDAPSVIGWEHWREGGQQAVRDMQAMLQVISNEGGLAPGLVSSFAHILVASLDELALVIAQAEDREAAIAEGRGATEELLRRLIGPA